MPGQRCAIRQQLRIVWFGGLLPVKGVVVQAVAEFLADAPADLEAQLGRHRQITGVEEAVDIAVQEKRIARIMRLHWHRGVWPCT